MAQNSDGKKHLVLASSSPRRQELLAMLGLPFQVIVSGVDESYEEGMPPNEIVTMLSVRKAAAVARLASAVGDQGIVIGSDTIVVCDGQVLGKPQHAEDAYQMLTMLQGREHQVYTGLACLPIIPDGHIGELERGTPAIIEQPNLQIQSYSGQVGCSLVAGWSMTKVYMKPLSAQQIEKYIASGEPFDKAGSYAIQGLGSTFVNRIDGDYFTVVGLPVSLLTDMLRSFDIQVL